MVKVVEGNLTPKNKQFAIVVSRFNEFIVQKLLEGALDTLKRHDIPDDNITVVWVPGSFEIPLVAQKLAQSKKYDAIIALGCIIRGGTPHFEYIAGETAKGIGQVILSTGVPVIFGILTTDNIEQAIERAGTKAGNKGAHAALSALEMVSLLDQI